MNETRKLEFCKNVFNTFFVAWMGAIAYIFANFDKIDNARIMLGFVAIFVILLFISSFIFALLCCLKITAFII